MIKDCMDYSASLCTANGELIAQAVNIPVMMCSTPDALRPTIAKFGKDLAPGDCLILSDPYEGGSHLPDIFMFMPIFHEGRLIAFSSTCAHHVDVGGMAPGSASTEATEIFQEGLRIPIVKLYERGVPNSALYELVLRNVRFPSMLQGDLEAQRSACMIGGWFWLTCCLRLRIHQQAGQQVDHP
jgi:N-methylhydantoinase B